VRGKNQRSLDAFRRVEAFLVTHRDALGRIAAAEGARDLKAAVARLEAHGLTQEKALMEVRGLLAEQRALEKELRTVHLQPIAQVARASLRREPAYKSLTRGTSELSGRSLVAEARALALAALPHAADLASAGFPADVLIRLTATIDKLERAMDRRANLVVERASATKGVAEETKNGHAAVKALGAVIEGRFAKDEVFLGEWRAARRVHAPG
jgi:hypothetical protein